MTDELTDEGWPRPMINGYPVPWVSPAYNLANMDRDRERICASGRICAVCGEPNYEQSFILVKARSKPHDLTRMRVEAMDNSVLHRRCVLLALARCPELVRLKQRGVLHLVVCTTREVTTTTSKDGRPRATVEGKHCTYVEIEA